MVKEIFTELLMVAIKKKQGNDVDKTNLVWQQSKLLILFDTIYRYFESSAATGDNVLSMYSTLVATILNKRWTGDVSFILSFYCWYKNQIGWVTICKHGLSV